jgi:hypothetical protein
MKAQLAMRLLADLMQWDETRATEEFAWLRLMVGAKYDHYHGFSPGARFYVNLLSWLGQFDPPDRVVAYAFIRKHLVFISQNEMHHLVALSMPIVQRAMRKEVAQHLNVPMYRTWGDEGAERRLALMGIRTLYVGLSDGAKIDVFRRDNEGAISTEQVVAASEISKKKWQKLTEALRERLDKRGFGAEEALFERVCLIDDFTASGATLIRKNEQGEWKGKIPTFCDQNAENLGTSLTSDCCIHVHHYLASSRATDTADEAIENFSQVASHFRFALTFSAVLSESIVIDDTGPADLVKLLKDYYDPSIEDVHLGKDVWYGYRQCGLPIVLYHNTPNNAVAILWATSGSAHTPPARRMKPLFARKKRHADHG